MWSNWPRLTKFWLTIIKVKDNKVILYWCVCSGSHLMLSLIMLSLGLCDQVDQDQLNKVF